jgi:4-amino-4-deoxy-L-arabinose transferase-like glycosyltransferase
MDDQAPLHDEPAPPADTGPDRARLRSLQLRRQVFLALGLLLCYGFFLQQPAWNEYSRYDLIRAVVEEGTVRIDSFEGNTGDKAFKDGHYYSDKAPGTAILGVPVYAAYLGLNRLAGIEEPPQEAAVAFLSFVISGLTTALLVVLLVRFLIPYTGEPWALLMGVALGLGSILFPFATMFFGHAASAFFLFASFYALWSARRRGGGSWRVVLAGVLGGLAVITELSAALGVLVLAGYALFAGPSVGRLARPVLRRLDLRTVALFAVGGVVPALLLFGHNTLAFGSPLSLGYTNLQNGGFAEGMSQGILGVTAPKLDVLADLTIGSRGLLRLSPWFVLAPLGLLALRRRAVRAEVIVAAAICAAFLVFNAGYYLPFGGWTPGPRFLSPALPFAAVLVALAPRRIRPVTVLLVVYSVAVMVAATATRPNAEELYEDPLLQLWIPRLLSGELADTLAWHRWGFAGIEPLLLLGIGLVIAVAGLLATRSRDRVSSVVAIASAVLLGVLIVACALPAPAPSSVWLADARDAAGPPALEIPASGSYRLTAGGKDAMLMWAQVANRGGAVDRTRIQFRVAPVDDPSQVRETWYADIPWSAGERDRTSLGWRIEDGVDPSTLAYQIRIVGLDDEVLATSGEFRPFRP